MPYSWQDPVDFQPKTRLYADQLDEIVNDLYYLREQLGIIWPVGLMVAWPADPPAPANWVLADGTIHANGNWPALAAVLGNRWGGTPGVSFAVPDMRGRAPVGAGLGAGLTNRALGTILGVETVALTLAQAPAHGHTVNDHTHSGTTADQDRPHWHGLEGHHHNIGHWHLAHIANVKYMANAVMHTHGGGAGVTAEASSPNDGFAGQVSVNVDGNANGAQGGQNISGREGWHTGAQNGNTGHLHTFGTGWASNRGTDSQGGNAAHENMQPSAVTHFIIRAA